MSCDEPLLKQAKTRHDSHEVSPPAKVFNQPASLFFSSIFFISKHLHLLDSLYGFPDIVGIQIFQRAREMGKFSNATEECLHGLELFTEAYGGQVLSQLNLCSAHLGIADYLEHLCLFSHLSQLDIGHCGLGDDHQLLQHIAQMNSLTQLGLCDNGLSNVGIQKLTIPLRMYKRGPVRLETLNLAENPRISERVSRFLRCFPSLRQLDLSATAITTDHCVMKMARELMMEVGHVEQFEAGRSLTTNQGWAADIVSQWMSQTCTRRNAHKPRSEAGKFYHRKASLAIKEDVPTKVKKIHLRRTMNNSSSANQASAASLKPLNKTGKLEGERSNSLTGKRLACLSKLEDDDNMMKMYLCEDGPSPPSSLSNVMAKW